MSGPISDAGKQGKLMAQAIAKQIAKEPFEILSDAGKQVAGITPEQQTPLSSQPPNPENPTQPFVPNPDQPQIDAARLIELEGEIKKIREEKKATELRQDAQESQQQAQLENISQPLVEPQAKRKRGLFGGMGQKKQAQKQQQRVERPMDPSG